MTSHSQYPRVSLLKRGSTRPLAFGALAAALGLAALTPFTLAANPAVEYKVVILQGAASGGTIEKGPDGLFTDTRRTEALNVLAQQGWEVIAVNGGVATDHSVYLRREPG